CKILILAKQIGTVNYFTDQQTKELLELKKKLGYDDIRFHRGDNCDLCSNDTFGRGFAEIEEKACACETKAHAASSNGHAASVPDMDRLVQLVTDQVMAALAKA